MPYDTLSDMNEGGIVKSVSFSVCVLHPHVLRAFLSYLPPLMKCTLGEASVVAYRTGLRKFCEAGSRLIREEEYMISAITGTRSGLVFDSLVLAATKILFCLISPFMEGL